MLDILHGLALDADGVLRGSLGHGGMVYFSIIHGLFQLTLHAQSLGGILTVKRFIDCLQSRVRILHNFELFGDRHGLRGLRCRQLEHFAVAALVFTS